MQTLEAKNLNTDVALASELIPPRLIPERKLKPHQKELLEYYRKARESKGFIPFPNPDSVRKDLILPNGRLQNSFLLPNGQTLRKGASIGLPQPCKNPKLLGLEYSAKDNGYWLLFTGENKERETQESWVLVSEDKSGREAIKSFEPHQKELLDLYRLAIESPGFISSPNPDSVRKDLIGIDGRLQKSFLLPNWETLGDVAPIGLRRSCINPKFHELKYSAEDKGFWIKISGTSKSGRTKTVEILVSDDPNARGEEAILRKKVLGANLKKGLQLPEEFRRSNSQDKELRKSKGKNLGEASSTVATSTNYNPVTFVKGEAFEQLMGIALALKYPNERVVPQYCLKVGIKDERGFYGMRVDYLVGDNKIFEIKWGAATSNIIKTFLRHTNQLKANGENSSYELIMLLENKDPNITPYTLFSGFVEDLYPEFSSLINKTQQLIAQLVEEKDHPRLEQVRDYLYSLLIEVKEGKQSLQRLEKLNQGLTLLLINEPNELKDFLSENTESYFNSLEANFEWEGIIYTDNIDPLQYYKEHPESFEVSYTFEAGTGKPFRKLTFATKIDRDLAVAQEVLFDKTQEFPDQEVVIKSPIFNFGGTLICTDHEVASTHGAKFVSSLSELREIVDETRNEKSKSFTDLVGFAEAWATEVAA